MDISRQESGVTVPKLRDQNDKVPGGVKEVEICEGNKCTKASQGLEAH